MINSTKSTRKDDYQNQLQNMISSASNLNRYSLHQNRLKYVDVQQYKVK